MNQDLNNHDYDKIKRGTRCQLLEEMVERADKPNPKPA